MEQRNASQLHRGATIGYLRRGNAGLCEMTLARCIKISSAGLHKSQIFSSHMMPLRRGIPISNPTTTNTEWGDGKTSTAARRVHAAGQYSHRRVALSRRMAGRQFQFRAYQAADPETGGRKIRRLLHGRPSGRAQHAGQCAQAQPHRHLVRAVHAVVGAGGRHRTYRADRDRLDHLRRALSCRPPLCLARSHQRWPRRLEHRHHLQSGRGAEFRARRSHGARRALQAARANSTMWSRACGIPSPTTPSCATSKRVFISIPPRCMCSTTRENISRCAARSTSPARCRAGR